jgi:hypothetical protein
MTKNRKFTITIEVEGGTHNITVKDDGGNEKKCKSIVLAAGCAEGREIYTFAWGHPKEAAWALGEGLSQAQGDDWWASFINCHCRDMALRTMPIGEPTTVENIKERWDKEDIEHAVEEAKKDITH